MANYVKPKIAISLLSISVLILIPLFESNFNAPVTIKRWSKLTWDDFKGFVPLFTPYEAGIASSVYLEYDSTNKRFHAYAAQHNVRSWAKRTRGGQDYGLNHEQYHFNITELHARKLNQYIGENPDGDEYLFRLRLGSIDIEHGEMQRQYDSETDHSLIIDKQRHWEYTIDSLLVLDSGWVIDQFSGAKIHFPGKPELEKRLLANQTPRRGYFLKKYDMTLAIYSFQNASIDLNVFEHNWQSAYSNNAQKVKFVNSDSIIYPLKTFVIAEDTLHYTEYSLWVYNNAYLYKAYARFPNNTGDTTGYTKIARSFINSFSAIDTDSTWISASENSNAFVVHSTTKKMEDRKDNNFRYCITRRGPQVRGFYRGPIFRDDGALLVAYDNFEHADSLHYKDILLLENDSYSYVPDSNGQIYFIPKAKLPKEKYRIDFGYIMEGSKIQGCYDFHYQSLDIGSEKNL